MPVTHEIWLKTDLKRPITVQPLHGLLFSADNQGDKVGFEVYDNGNPVTLSGVITGYIIKNNGETVIVSGSFDGNRAWIICPANAYDAIGPIYIAIKNRASTASTAITTTLGMCTTYVERTATGEIVTPTYKIIDAATIASMITEMETATTAANTAATNANNKAGAANTAAANANEKASLANTAATNANTAKDNANAAAAAANAAAAAAPTQITNQTTAYQNSTSGTAIPTGTWLDTQPNTPQGQYLWIRKTLTWDNGETTTLYSVSRMGMDGSGSVSSVNNISPDANGNVDLGAIVHKVNNVSPDSSGNIALPIDDAPTAGSDNPVKSGALETALDAKVNKAGDTMSGTLIMTNNSGPRNSTSPQIGFYFDGNDWVANIQYTSNKRFCFIERDASDNSIREQFYLPIITSASGTRSYDILTSKTFNPGEDFSSKVTFNVAAAHATFYRVGNLCMVAYQSNAQTFPVDTKLFALPNGYRPSTQTFAVCSVNTATYGLVVINANGNVNVSQIMDGTVSGRLYLNCVYVI
jgi:hypothetical protein